MVKKEVITPVDLNAQNVTLNIGPWQSWYPTATNITLTLILVCLFI